MNDISSAVIKFCSKHLQDFYIRNDQILTRYCPFCKGGDHRDQNTFALSLETGAYNCMRGGCGVSGSFRDLCKAFGEEMEFKKSENIQMNAFRKVNKTYSLPDESKLSKVTDDIISYFNARRISKDTMEAFGIASDENENIVFPFYRDGKLVYVKYRKPFKFNKEDKTPKEWGDRNTEPILFGMDHVSFSAPLYITEGQIDAMSLYEAGIHNVVSVPCGCNNFDWVSSCWEWLENFDEIVLFGDNDEPGQKMVNTLLSRLGEDRCRLINDYPMLIVNGEEKGRFCKDANEILYCYGIDTLYDIAKGAEPAPIKGVINLADVEYVDPSSVPRIYSKVPELDQMIGGFGEGGLTTFSGKRGEGKSTMLGTISLNAIQQGYKVCAYSGELSAYRFLEWILLQATEAKYIGVKQDRISGKNYATVSPQIQQRIREWINEKYFLFDNTTVGDESQTEAILKVFTMCARRYGVKIFIVDNLLVALGATPEEENKAQAKFAAQLKQFAVKFDAHVILVAHPRKIKAGDKISNDDVAGSSAITNLADTVISVEKPNLRITKNREFGTTGLIICDYNPANRRIYQNKTGDNIVYGWNHEGIEVPDTQACTMKEFCVQSGNPEEQIPF